MRWIGWNHLSTDKNVVHVEEKDTTDVDVQYNLNVEVHTWIDLCIFFFYLNEMEPIDDQFAF